jgi:TonB family protein
MSRIAASLLTLIAFATPAIAQLRPADAPSLPSADRIAPWIREKLGDHASADVRVCVAGDGHVTSIALVHTSQYDAFDRAVLKDVASWHFEATGDARCRTTTISYDASAH